MSVAARAANKRKIHEIVHIAQVTAPFHVFARWLYVTLKDMQADYEQEQEQLREARLVEGKSSALVDVSTLVRIAILNNRFLYLYSQMRTNI